MRIGVPKETYPGERRVALVPDSVALLIKAGHAVWVEAGAGEAAGFADSAFKEKGASLVTRSEVFGSAEIIVQVRALGYNAHAGSLDLIRFKSQQVLIAMCDPLGAPQPIADLARCGVTAFALELMPRITRAQSMDVLSSMATIAGYKAVLMAADCVPRMFPMLMTAAGTVAAAHVFVIGAGVAGLQAIATARRLGAVVKAYDVRPAVKEQVESLGAKFVVMQLETQGAEGKGGYAQEMGESFLRKQRELMMQAVKDSHVVITTAAIPGKKSPVLITGDMVRAMPAGSAIVDLAAERGGNCELTRPDETVVVGGVTIMGPTNLPSTIPIHASQMYSRNVLAFVKELTDAQGRLALDAQNEIHRETLLTQGGQVVHPRVKELLGIQAGAAVATSTT